MAQQEPGLRPARALPYGLEVAARTDLGRLTLSFANSGAAGACFNVYADGGKAGPWFYTVEAGKTLEGAWEGDAHAAYDLTVHGPNGFLRAFRGAYAAGGLLVRQTYDPATDRLLLALHNDDERPRNVVLTPKAYSRAGPRRRTLAPGASLTEAWPIRASAHWYDIAISSPEEPGFLRRLAGHVETGAPSLSDPANGLA
jgi:phospholipase C